MEEKEIVKNEHVHTEACQDVEAVREERRMRHWVIRWMVRLASFVVVMIVCSTMWAYVIQGRDFETTAVGGIVDNIFTVVKFIFN